MFGRFRAQSINGWQRFRIAVIESPMHVLRFRGRVDDACNMTGTRKHKTNRTPKKF